MNVKTTWIDLTDIEKWEGQHGGTQRVVYGIAFQYYRASRDGKENAKFFVFDDRNMRFYESSMEPIINRVESVVNEATQDSTTSKVQKIQHYVVEYTPQFIRSNDRARKALFKVGKVAYIQLNNVRKGLQKNNKKAAQRGKEVTFTKDDTLLILGKPWDIPVYSEYLAKLKQEIKFKMCAVIYDLVIPLYPHLHSSELFEQYTQCIFSLAQSADMLFPISKSSENDLKKFCKVLEIPIPKTKVIRLGDELAPTITAERPNLINKGEHFLLCVGTIEVRKNHTLLYYAYKLAQERGIKLPRLVIVGRPGWLADDIYKLFKGDKTLEQQVTIIEHATDNHLAWMYKNCLFSVYPSMYEGWGLPVAESLQYGKYCVASNSSSVPEIAGDLLDYFSPFSVDEFLQNVIKYLDEETRSTREGRIQEYYNTTTWEMTYKQISQY